ncbi:LysR substrate-binding domain-containing protein [Variovorax terrae]|uniref:LysR substrate-binding domain-containing protein n=1 Tax=Variovorax terrae TaxID=2923278 RepID=A0A9X1VWM6_9BURK|nr:LysR substrate-binding domain-containing protein [Variovorax terrae]MCJ0765166.1 LysR substrate-binding domain-containing protein [Variovorax terrae]
MNQLAPLRYLVALSEHRHFARAAQACHITQPALSNALRALEKEFGVAIVRRGRTYAGLTPEGEQVLAAAQRMLHEHESLQQALRGSAQQPVGRLRLGVVPTALPVAARFAAQLRALHPGIVPVVSSLSSQEIEAGLDSLALDLGLGFTERVHPRAGRAAPFAVLPQYTEQYFLLRRAAPAHARFRLGPPLPWREAAALPLCLLTPDMHNRSIVDAAFARAGVAVAPAMETNSVLTLALSVQAGELCSVLPGALVAAVRGHGGLQAQPLVRPEVGTPVGFMLPAQARPARVLQAALAFAQEPRWLHDAAQHSGALQPAG